MGNAGRSAATLLAASVAMLLLSCSARDLLAQRAEALNDDQLCEVRLAQPWEWQPCGGRCRSRGAAAQGRARPMP